MARGPQTDVRVGLFGLLGSGNLGNDGSLDALVAQLRELDAGIQLGFFCMGADVIAARYDAPARYLQWYEPHAGRAVGLPAALLKVVGKLLDPVRTLLWVRRFDAVLVPGMGVLETTVPVRPWALPYSLFWLAVTARATGARLALVAVGADEVRSWVTRQLVVWSARLAQYRSYRDELSRAAMQSMGVDVSGDEVHPDLVFTLPRPKSRVTAGLVAVGVMNYRGSDHERVHADDLHRHYVAAMVQLVLWLLDAGRTVRLYATDQEDQPVLETLLSTVKDQRPDDPAVEQEPVSTVQELMDGLAQAELVVGSRYHNVLCGLMLSKPTVSVGYAGKHAALMADYGMTNYSVPARHVDPRRLVAACEALEGNRAQVVAELDRRNGEISRATQEQVRAVSRFVLGVPSSSTDRPGPVSATPLPSDGRQAR